MLTLDDFVASGCQARGHVACDVCQSCSNTMVLETLPQRRNSVSLRKNMIMA